MPSKRVLITGAAGFIGSRLVSVLLAEQFICLGIDNLETGCSPLKPRANLDFRQLDICEEGKLIQTFRDFSPEIVVHLAAIHHIPTCELNPSKALRVNIVGTQNVLEASALVGSGKVVLASTGGVYDWIEGPLTEDTPLRPTDVYTLSKATNERQLAFWVAKTGRTGVIARIFNTIGRNDPNGHLIPDILRQFRLNGHRPVIIQLGNLHTQRDYIYVEDTAACLAQMIQSEQVTGLETFNVGTGEQHDVQSIVECIARIRSRTIQCQSDRARIRTVDRSSQLADMTKTCRKLSWAPRYRFEDALRLTVQEEPSEVAR